MITPYTIILSAGKSSRMGSDKALLTIESKTFIELLTQTFAAFSNNIFLIVSNQLKNKLLDLHLELPKTTIIINPAPELGRMSSVLTGIRHCGPEPVFLHNVDTPIIKVSTLEKLLENYSDNQTIIPSYNNIKGHPILLGKKITYKLTNQNITTNLKHFIFGNPHKIIEVDDIGITLNINTKDDYMKLIDLTIK